MAHLNPQKGSSDRDFISAQCLYSLLIKQLIIRHVPFGNEMEQNSDKHLSASVNEEIFKNQFKSQTNY